jgi:hypothetical protein
LSRDQGGRAERSADGVPAAFGRLHAERPEAARRCTGGARAHRLGRHGGRQDPALRPWDGSDAHLARLRPAVARGSWGGDPTAAAERRRAMASAQQKPPFLQRQGCTAQLILVGSTGWRVAGWCGAGSASLRAAYRVMLSLLRDLKRRRQRVQDCLSPVSCSGPKSSSLPSRRAWRLGRQVGSR